MHNPAPRVLVFDSGVGGLSVAREVFLLHPQCQLHYLADNAYFPYGLKPDELLTQRIIHVLSQAIAQLQPHLVVVACNTASTLALTALRQRFDLPFVGVVPAIKPAAGLTQTGTIGLLATPATIARPYTQQLIADFAPNATVLRYGSSRLVTLAEAFLAGQTLNREALQAELNGLLQQPGGEAMDPLVLACTHFPLLKAQLMAISPRPLHWVDSGQAVAKRVGSYLPQSAASPPAPCLTLPVYHTGPLTSAQALPVEIARYFQAQLVVSLRYFPV